MAELDQQDRITFLEGMVAGYEARVRELETLLGQARLERDQHARDLHRLIGRMVDIGELIADLAKEFL